MLQARFMRIVGLLILATVLSACGYQLRKGDKPLAALGSAPLEDRPQRIYVPVVENMTTRVGPESVLTNAIREELAIQPGIQVVNSEQSADFVLVGQVSSFGSRFKSSTSQASATQEANGGMVQGQVTAADIEVFLGANFRLLEHVNDQGQMLRRLLWVKGVEEELSIEAYNRFSEASGSSSAPHINRSREQLQLRNLSEIVARKVLDQVTQSF